VAKAVFHELLAGDFWLAFIVALAAFFYALGVVSYIDRPWLHGEKIGQKWNKKRGSESLLSPCFYLW
jgi:hypothetical protein